jgi:hypothetical protein
LRCNAFFSSKIDFLPRSAPLSVQKRLALQRIFGSCNTLYKMLHQIRGAERLKFKDGGQLNARYKMPENTTTGEAAAALTAKLNYIKNGRKSIMTLMKCPVRGGNFGQGSAVR